MSQKPKYVSANWMEITDPRSGRVYYAHKKTKESHWKRPEEKIRQDIYENGYHKSKKEKEQPKPVANEKQPEDVWVERQDPETGRIFYYNPKLKKTSWHRPETVLSADAHKTDTGKGQWVEKVDPRTGRPFYYNPVLQLTSWDNPDAVVEEPQSKRLSATGNVVKRFSQLANRVSMGFSNLTPGGVAGPFGRNSASFAMDQPALPVNRNSARASLRLGADDIANDVFQNLRQMQNAKPMSVRISTSNKKATEDFLMIDLKDDMNRLDLNFDLVEFQNYANQNFNLKKRGLFTSKKVNLNNLQAFQKGMLKRPLHLFHDKNLANDSLLAFKLLQNYIGVKKKGRGDATFAQDFAKMGIQTTRAFQAELYALLIKQSTKNPHEEMLENVYELFALCCGCFPPTDEIAPFVQSHLRAEVESGSSERTQALAMYALLRLRRYRERLHFPSLQEISATRALAPVELTVELISASPVTIQVDAWTSVKDVKERIQASFNIKNGAPFSLFEVSKGDQDRHLSDDDMILDVLGYWENNKGEFQCVYKIRLYFDINEDDIAAVELAYLQTVFEVIDQRYPCEEIDAIRLAALEAQEKFGDFNGTDVFGDQLGAYIPHRFFNKATAENMKQDIYSEYQRMQGTEKLQCMINYMNYVKKWQFYGCAYFFAEPIQLKVLGKEFPKVILIAINAKGVMIVDHESKAIIVDYPYSEIVTWGHSESNFVLVVGNLVRSTKLFFSTIDGRDMNQLIHAYVHKLMEAQTEEEKDYLLAQQLGS